MRRLKIIEHISLDGVIQVSGEGGFPHGGQLVGLLAQGAVILSYYKVVGPLKTG